MSDEVQDNKEDLQLNNHIQTDNYMVDTQIPVVDAHDGQNEQEGQFEQDDSNTQLVNEVSDSKQQNDEMKLQMEALQQRYKRMEQLLVKKNANISELTETEAKLKRLLAMAKRSIDNSKQEITDKDTQLQRLQQELKQSNLTLAQNSAKRRTFALTQDTPEARRILIRVAHSVGFWCLVEYSSENEESIIQTRKNSKTTDSHNGEKTDNVPSDDTFGWHWFASEKELKDYANRLTGEPLKLPPLSLTPNEVERNRKSLKDEIDHVQEEFRRYRVRAEITRKQQDAEIRKLSASAVARQSEQISETGLVSELQATKAHAKRISQLHVEAEEKENEWRRKYEKLAKNYEKLSGTMGETILATEWRERYEQMAKDKDEIERQLNEVKSGVNGNAAGFPHSSSELQALKVEYSQFRRKALQLVDHKDRELLEMQSPLLSDGFSLNSIGQIPSGVGVRAGVVRRMSNSSVSSLGGFENPNATTTNEYLKNIVLKYMTAEQEEGKEHMEKAIATVLNFTPKEIMRVQEKRQQQGWFW